MGQQTSIGKAFEINKDPGIYGTFAEIGAGQETVNFFYKAGLASQTVVKSMSAYDMTVSDEIYGKQSRYVSEGRILTMLEHEYQLVEKRLRQKRGKKTRFFAFAVTAATTASSAEGTNKGTPRLSHSHAWMGLRFQARPNEAFNDVVFHVSCLDKSRLQQHEALGILGVNLIYACFYHFDQTKKLLSSLAENLSRDRIEIQGLSCSGPAFKGLSPISLNLEIMTHQLSPLVYFSSDERSEFFSDAIFNHSPLIIYKDIEIIKSFQKSTKALTGPFFSARSNLSNQSKKGGRRGLPSEDLRIENLSPQSKGGGARRLPPKLIFFAPYEAEHWASYLKKPFKNKTLQGGEEHEKVATETELVNDKTLQGEGHEIIDKGSSVAVGSRGFIGGGHETINKGSLENLSNKTPQGPMGMSYLEQLKQLVQENKDISILTAPDCSLEELKTLISLYTQVPISFVVSEEYFLQKMFKPDFYEDGYMLKALGLLFEGGSQLGVFSQSKKLFNAEIKTQKSEKAFKEGGAKNTAEEGKPSGGVIKKGGAKAKTEDQTENGIGNQKIGDRTEDQTRDQTGNQTGGADLIKDYLIQRRQIIPIFAPKDP